jgi:hypothetical protein
MFKELVASQLITELKIREGKYEAESALKRLMYALEETSSEEAELPGSNPCDNANSRNTDQEQRETNNQTFDLDVAEITSSTLDENSCTNNVVHTGSEIRLDDKQISVLQEVLQWANTPKRTLKRITDRMRFVITCTAFKVLFQEKENKNKEEELAKLERKKERGKKELKITAGKLV